MNGHARDSVSRSRRVAVLCCLIIGSQLGTGGCAGKQAMADVASEPGAAGAQRDIFVFFDGTKNDAKSQTNVWRLKQLVEETKDPNARVLYLDGVGSADSPLLGAILGKGMEKRIKQGYEHLALNYRPGDRIFIFGFSRGAHQARALAGQLAYSGLPRVTEADESRLMRIANKIIETTKVHRDVDHEAEWKAWMPGQAPPLADEIKSEHELDMLPVEVAFVGVWDTVPGSSFIEFVGCKEIEETRERLGDRYKSGSYPPIRHMAHAMALDEKRSKFSPIILCPASNEKLTKIDEVWFPGAHSDVGGGYEDSDGKLPAISLNWMITLLQAQYAPLRGATAPGEGADGLAHWSIGDSPGNSKSTCVDRTPGDRSNLHASVEARRNAGLVPVSAGGKIERYPYPLKCRPDGSRNIPSSTS